MARLLIEDPRLKTLKAVSHAREALLHLNCAYLELEKVSGLEIEYRAAWTLFEGVKDLVERLEERKTPR